MGALCRKMHILHSMTPYLEYEASTKTDNNEQYPYPAKMPSFLAHIGRISLNEFILSVVDRKKRLSDLLSVVKEEGMMPKAYFNKDNDIVPLRFAFISKNRQKYTFIDNWVWFKQPIVASTEPLGNFGYEEGMCPCAEEVGACIMNLPILLNEKKHAKLIKKIIQKI